MASAAKDTRKQLDATDKFEPLDPPLPSSSSSYPDEVEEHDVDHDPEKGFPAATSDHPQRPELSRVVSKPFSLRKVPVSQRSGWLSRCSLLYEAEEPKGYPRSVKWFITFEIALAAVAAPMGSAIILRMLIQPAISPFADKSPSRAQRYHCHFRDYTYDSQSVGRVLHVEHVAVPALVVCYE